MKIRRVLLLDIFIRGAFIAENVGQGSIAAFLNENGYESLMLAYTADKINYQRIIDFQPDIIGFSIQQQTVGIIRTNSQHFKELFPKAYMFLGGYMPTYNTNQLMEDLPHIDFIIRGEGEITTLQLLNVLNMNRNVEDIDGISYRKDHVIINNPDAKMIPDLDLLPFPLRTTMVEYGLRSARIDGARGCTSQCSFCAIHGFWSNSHKTACSPWRSKSVTRIIDEVEYIVNTYHVNRFHFLDSSFENPHYNNKRIFDIANEIIKRGLLLRH